MDNRYRTGQVQINVSNDNSILNATQTQIINYIESKKIPKMMAPNPVPYSHYVSKVKKCAVSGIQKMRKLLRCEGEGLYKGYF